MSSQQSNGDETMSFMPVARYQRQTSRDGTASTSIPGGWQRHYHPNGDVYYYHPERRLLTPEDIRNPDVLGHVEDAWRDHLECLRTSNDNALSRLPSDFEITVNDVTDHAATIGMFSRSQNKAYKWTEEDGLREKGDEVWWTHVAEYPSHHPDLPPGTEAAFLNALNAAQLALTQGVVLPFTQAQVALIIQRYHELQVASQHAASSRNAIASLGWLMGAVMPLDANSDLYELMATLQI